MYLLIKLGFFLDRYCLYFVRFYLHRTPFSVQKCRTPEIEMFRLAKLSKSETQM